MKTSVFLATIGIALSSFANPNVFCEFNIKCVRGTASCSVNGSSGGNPVSGKCGVDQSKSFSCQAEYSNRTTITFICCDPSGVASTYKTFELANEYCGSKGNPIITTENIQWNSTLKY